MNKDLFIETILKDMRLPVKHYDKPFIVTICGHSGSGKSEVSRVLSKELEIYV